MIIEDKKKQIKKLQRENEIFKHIITIMNNLFKEKDILTKIYCNRVEITTDGSVLLVYMHSHCSKDDALENIKKVNAYKKQIYHQLCQRLSYKYVPKINFVYDERQIKIDRINQILDSLKDEDKHNQE